MKKIKKEILCLILIFFCINIEVGKSQSIEYKVKASLIEKFCKFTDWGENLQSDYFIIGILGDSPFEGELEKATKNSKIKNKSVKIKYFTKYQETNDCNVLFICNSERNKIGEITNYLANYKILTVSDSPGFCKKGVHLNLFIDESETIKFEVNPNSLKKSNLKVELQLLNFGKIVN